MRGFPKFGVSLGGYIELIGVYGVYIGFRGSPKFEMPFWGFLYHIIASAYDVGPSFV